MTNVERLVYSAIAFLALAFVAILAFAGYRATSPSGPIPTVQAAVVTNVSADPTGTLITVTTPDDSVSVVRAPIGTPVSDEVPVYMSWDGTWEYGTPQDSNPLMGALVGGLLGTAIIVVGAVLLRINNT